ncbi:MAG: hypothetical protein CL489_06270 [Acidobacteria bacterium]|nr:hypothetical protein [Acidobacteriota bacterium]|tara:strand:- start:39193 stop:39393 length:201 start_codon:yes stop_codon:yes gene_type:complete
MIDPRIIPPLIASAVCLVSAVGFICYAFGEYAGKKKREKEAIEKGFASYVTDPDKYTVFIWKKNGT